MNYCKNCGNQITGRFCQSCGTDNDPQQGEKVEEIVKKLYTLRAGISLLSQELDKASKENRQLRNEYDAKTEASLNQEVTKNKELIHKVKGKLVVLKMTLSQAQAAKKKQEQKSKLANMLSKVFYVLAGVLVFIVPFVTAFISHETGTEIGSFAGIWAPIIAGVVSAGIGLACSFELGIKYVPISNEDIVTYQKIEPEFKALENRYLKLKEKNDSIFATINAKAVEYERFGSAMYDSLKNQFGSFLNPADWENIDLLIFYFESGRALTLREALQLVDRQRQTDSILEAIDEATQKICRTIERGFVQIETTLVGCASILSSQLQAIQLQQTELAISVSAMQSALQSKANTSSKQLMEDVHRLRIYADNYSIKQRNS